MSKYAVWGKPAQRFETRVPVAEIERSAVLYLLREYVYKSMIVVGILLLAVFIALHSGCNNPTEPDPEHHFYLNSVVFSGDSTGEYRQRTPRSRISQIPREENKGEPYCEVTISWIYPEEDSVVIYTIYRSLEPGIESGSAPASIVGTSIDSIFVDSNSLEWGTIYHYAVSGMKTDSTFLWSDEDSIGMPNSQFPTPSILNALDLPLGKCVLSWSECPDSDFASYVLTRQRWQHIFDPETLGVFNGVQETIFIDSVPPFYSPRYYMIITTDTQGLSTESESLQYTSGFGLPWYVSCYINAINYMPVGGLISSQNENFIYFIIEQLNGFDYLYTFNTNSGSFTHSNEWADKWDFVYAPQQSCLLVSRSNASNNFVELRDEGTLEILDQLELPFENDGLLALPTGGRAILSPSGTSHSYVLDISSMELVDTLDYEFNYSQVIEGFGTYIMGMGPLRRIDPTTLQVVAQSTIYPDDFTDLMVSSSNELCLILNPYFYKLDPYSLSIINSTNLPMDSWDTGALIEAQDTVYAYICCEQHPDQIIRVYNTETLEYIGQVSNLPDCGSEWPLDMIILHSRQEIWCRFFNIFIQTHIGIYNISL